MRTIIDLPQRQMKALSEHCRKNKISRAEAVRRAVDLFLSEEVTGARRDAFGAWADVKEDSRIFVDRLREEWER